MAWTYDPTMLTKILEHAGYDVDDSQARGLGGGGSLSARRDRNDGTVLVAIDSGARFKATLTHETTVPTSESATVENLAIRIVVEETRTETIATELDATEHLSPLLDFVDRRLAGEKERPARFDNDEGEQSSSGARRLGQRQHDA